MLWAFGQVMWGPDTSFMLHGHKAAGGALVMNGARLLVNSPVSIIAPKVYACQLHADVRVGPTCCVPLCGRC